jgi:hypothetical protein
MVSLDIVSKKKEYPPAYKETGSPIHFMKISRTVPKKIMGMLTPWSSLFHPEECS